MVNRFPLLSYLIATSIIPALFTIAIILQWLLHR